jgi:hypothetical protein
MEEKELKDSDMKSQISGQHNRKCDPPIWRCEFGAETVGASCRNANSDFLL